MRNSMISGFLCLAVIMFVSFLTFKIYREAGIYSSAGFCFLSANYLLFNIVINRNSARIDLLARFQGQLSDLIDDIYKKLRELSPDDK